ncbi:formyltetrahydrofolate deformylase [Ponticaulis sp.]|uniref:formyltetrahydrofolate deformylase n=1 Tax=Ponticaulis sp. TaxID=2020902 RepID=UPI000C5CCE00|nr:formyltetrahydrofolate deformylase [Ponticaulis sp.]MAJ08324.1 formyltetrahydrofolate deformylase [Ponticaulis sp.]HBH88419.1 formyltetrahydrofolate deformylase [Hyphomonadaceae bacterium]HBJ93735.1 formyltetrahydrofolate deformylase [Hyphomonadaceae bacterium]|tara:strand:+ start:62941 stop:63795 length:855 start_codon:yes stop_codon:yes gene_type:complete
MPKSYILTLACTDRSGIIAAVSNVLLNHSCFIARSRSFGDEGTKTFFLRLSFQPENDSFSLEQLQAELKETAARLEADWDIEPEERKMKTLIMVSKLDHCANALLYGARIGELPIEPVAILSNHPDLAPTLQHWGLPFHTVPVTPDTKPQAEQAMFDIIEQTGAELTVLARYMQILSNDACQQLSGKCINIHHSFLPSFKGARPYHRAHERGVKMIGATAHYVTADLDEGPILAQVTQDVDHSHSAGDFVAMGRSLEATALVRAVKAHAERRVFLNGLKTVVFA